MFEKFINTKYLLFVVAFLFLIIICETAYFLTVSKETELVDKDNISLAIDNVKEEQEPVISNIHVDIKGAVKNPGVYELESNLLIIDAINKAGGLSKTAYTDNINLSKQLMDNMVIYVYTKSEYKKLNSYPNANNVCQTKVDEVNNCIDQGISVIKTEDKQVEKTVDVTTNNTNVEASTNENALININTATETELMSLTGIGESKAKAIISYRQENGNFASIEDIKNVTGIGDSVFEKIKNNITV